MAKVEGVRRRFVEIGPVMGLTGVLLSLGCGERSPEMKSIRSALTIAGPSALTPAAPDSVNGDSFGYAQVIEGNTAVISGHGSNSHGAFVFQGSGTSWQQVARLLPPDDSSLAAWGANLSISTDRIAIGSFTFGGNAAGSVYTFVGSGDQWTFEERIPPLQGTTTFGSSLAVSGDTLAVGEWGRFVTVYVREQGHWNVQQTLMPLVTDNRFGETISLDGDRVAIADPSDTVNGHLNAGSVYVFDRANGVWSSDRSPGRARRGR